MTFLCVKCKIHNYSNTQIQNTNCRYVLYFLKSWGFNNINYDIPMLHTQRERLELLFVNILIFVVV